MIDRATKASVVRDRAGSRFVPLLFDTYYVSRHNIEEALRSFDLSVTAYRLLRIVYDNTGCTMGTAASLLLLKPNRVSVAAAQLRLKGLLSARRKPEDLRLISLEASEIGAEFVHGATETLSYAMSHAPYEVTTMECQAFEDQAVSMLPHLSEALAMCR